MGTRHMIGVVIDGDFKIAQYGQWDGYPGGQGATVLDFAQTADLTDFADKCRALRWISAEEADEVNSTENWTQKYPHLSRDAGAGILSMVANGEAEFLMDNRDFPLDSLFCEWAYVLDLDEQTLEVYKGYQTSTPKEGRWAGLPKDAPGTSSGEYKACERVAVYSLDDLPTETEFVRALGEEEEEE